MKSKAVFIAATGQNVGKTTTCLGLVSGLLKRHGSVGYLKPVGQEHVQTESGACVDKDVLLFRSHFQLKTPYEAMSPVLFPNGFTRDYLDGKVQRNALIHKIQTSSNAIIQKHPITIIEGTGHTGVGSIVDLNNAQVASLLNIPVVLVASGGLGSSFDELELNRTQCEKYGAKVAGIILNRVLSNKRSMIIEYMNKALSRWNIPLLGCIPFDSMLSMPTMGDFELLFQTQLIAGQINRWRHFDEIRLIANAIEMNRVATPNQLIITPANREDTVLAILTHYWDLKLSHPDETLSYGLILTGKEPLKTSLAKELQQTDLPVLYTPLSSFAALKILHSHTHKIRAEDTVKIEEAIRVVETNINFDLLESIA